jgi:hypothetical protein
MRSLQLFALESVGGQPVTSPGAPVMLTAQLALPTCFEELLLERVPSASITESNVDCRCAFDCDVLVADC